MTTFPGAPRVLKGGIVLVEPETGTVARVIVLQYNPDTLTRTLQPRSTAAEAGDRLEALRLTGPPVETFKLDAELDATDQLEFPDQHPNAVESGIQPQLAVLETLVYPLSSVLQQNDQLARAGTLEIAPIESQLTLLVWSKNRILPVRLTDFSITEEQFDTLLNPIRAKVSLGMRVLSINDLNFEHRGASLYMAYQQQKERLAGMSERGTLATLGISRIG
jgi:hypothetical protein